MTKLSRYNEVPKIVGTDTNFVYEADDNGQVVFADNAITALRERDERIAELEKRVRNLEVELEQIQRMRGAYND